MEMTMYDNLLQLPLFQGLCKDDFTSIIERVKFHFLTLKDGETIARQGDACRRLVFLLNGSISAYTTDDDHNFTLSETISAPYIIARCGEWSCGSSLPNLGWLDFHHQ